MSMRSIHWLTAALAATVSLAGCAIDEEMSDEEVADEEGAKEMRYIGARVLAATLRR